MRRFFQDISALILYITLVVIVFSGVVTGRGVFFAGDISQHYVPWETFVDEEIESGHFPLWDPGIFGGYPIHAEGQSGILYPITRLVYFLFDGALAFSIDMLIHLALGGFFVYLLVRMLKLGFYPALYSGAVFALAGYPVSLIVNAPILRSVVWMPLIVMVTWNTWHGGGIRNAAWLALIIGLQIFAGSIQVVAMSLVLILFLSILFFIDTIVRKKISLTPIFFILLIGLPLGFIIAGVQILPTNELYQQSFIHLDLKEDTVYSFSPYHLLDMLIPPYWAQNPSVLERESIPFQMTLFLYLGIIPFFMALIGFFVSRTPLVWKIIAVIGLLMGLGEYTFFYPMMLKIIPLLGNFRAPDRFLVFYALSISILAGYGFRTFLGQELPSDPRIKRKWYIFWAIVALLLFIFGLIIDLLIPGSVENLYATIRDSFVQFIDNPNTIENLALIIRAALLEILAAILLLIILVVFAIRYRKSMERTLAIGILIFLLSFVESIVYLKMNPGTKLITPDYYKSKPASVEAILRAESTTDDQSIQGVQDIVNNTNFINESNEGTEQNSSGNFRIAACGYYDYSVKIFGNTPLLLWYHGGGRKDDFMKFREILNPNFGNVYDLDYISGISSLYSSRWNRYMEMVEIQEDAYKQIPGFFGPRTHLWDLSGVRYIISSEELPTGRLDLIYQGDVFVYKNKRVLPKAFVIYPEKVIPENQTSRDLMMKGDIDLSKTLILDGPIPENIQYNPYSNIVRYSPAVVDEYDSQRVKISGVSLTDGYLVLSDAYYPGWECRINGKKTSILKSYCYFRAVPLKAGKFEAVFNFRPSSFRMGLLISILGCVIWVILLIGSFSLSRKTEGLMERDSGDNYQRY